MQLVRKGGGISKKKDLKNYVPDYEIPDDLEDLYFPNMKKGERLDDMTTARQIVAELQDGGITKPRFPTHVWIVRTMHATLSIVMALLIFSWKPFATCS